MGYTLVQRDHVSDHVGQMCNPKPAIPFIFGNWVSLGVAPGSDQKTHVYGARQYKSCHLNEFNMTGLYIPAGGPWTIRWEQVSTLGMTKNRYISVCAVDPTGTPYPDINPLGAWSGTFLGNGTNAKTFNVNAWTPPEDGAYVDIVLAAQSDATAWHNIVIENSASHDTLIELLPGGGRLVDRVPLGSLVDGGLVS